MQNILLQRNFSYSLRHGDDAQRSSVRTRSRPVFALENLLQLRIPHHQNWYEHHPQPVTEGENVTIPWYFTIHTKRQINANRPDTVIKDRKGKPAN